MFKDLYYYYTNNIDTPSITAKVNIWFFINIRVFKLKVNNILNFFILSLNNLKLKKLNIYYKNLNFEFIFIYTIYFLLFMFTLLYFI